MSDGALVNRGEYLSGHYLAEVLPKALRKPDGPAARWAEREKAGEPTPRTGLRRLKAGYFAARPDLAGYAARLAESDTPLNAGPSDAPPADEPTRTHHKELHELHAAVLRALGFTPPEETETAPHDATGPRAVGGELIVEVGGREYPVPVAYAGGGVVAVECGFATEVDAALDPERAGRLLTPVPLDGRERLTSGAKLAAWLFGADEPPRYVLLLAGAVLILADRATWGEGRYLAANLDVALSRADPAELSLLAALLSADALHPPAEGGAEPLAELLDASRRHAVGVSAELREGVRASVEIIANEVLDRLREQGVSPADLADPGRLGRELGREALRYLYRVLFLLYAEARPDLGILPVDDEDYTAGYSLARLGDLVVRDLGGEESRRGFHLYESLDLLFRCVNTGHRPRPAGAPDEPLDAGLRFEPLRAELFEPRRTGLIGADVPAAPGHDADDPHAPRVDTRLRNAALHAVLRLLMLTHGRRGERGGFISYAHLGINQLGAVYEGLMSYTGFIADEELYEVAKGGDPSGGSWMIPASRVDTPAEHAAFGYPDEVFVREVDADGSTGPGFRRHPAGSFVYRLAGRDRQTSASYYTPESLTRVTVRLALDRRIAEAGGAVTARDVLGWRICEPALGSGAFLNEAINQVAGEYLRRRQAELDTRIDPECHEAELQRAKAYVALHNCYGVDLNDTAVELAEVSIWLNVMHPGLQEPWFGLHLRRGDSLVGAGRRVYEAGQLAKGAWLTAAPREHPLSDGPPPDGAVYHFLLPARGWGAVAGEREARELAPEDTGRLAAWRRTIRKSPTAKGRASQVRRLQELTRRADHLWGLVRRRLEISESDIRRHIDVWGADWIDQPAEAITKEKVVDDLTAPGTPYWRLKTVLDAWCALWFWPVDRAGLLDGTDDRYRRLAEVSLPGTGPADTGPADTGTADTGPADTGTAEPGAGTGAVPDESAVPLGLPPIAEQATLFGGEPEQLTLGQASRPRSARPAAKRDPLRPVIALAGLDDWLDFAEAVLGRTDVPADSLGAHFATLRELEPYEDELPHWTGMDSPDKLAERFPWLTTAEQIAEQRGFFHWELPFAQVFATGGFDLQVGNPPWVRPDWKENLVLAELDPWFALVNKPDPAIWQEHKAQILERPDARRYFLDELAANSGTVETLGSPAVYPLLAGTRPDLYRAFMCRAWANLGPHGMAGLIHPDTHFGGTKEGRLRAAAYAHLRFHAHFSNRLQLFEIEGTRQFGIHLYGSPQPIGFTSVSWLFDPATLVDSLGHDGTGPVPGIKHDGAWELRPHAKRLVTVDAELLAQWRGLSGDTDTPVEQTPLLYPVSTDEQGAIEALSTVDHNLAAHGFEISQGYNETNGKKDGYIRWHTGFPEDLCELIVQGPHLGIGTPLAKQPNDPCTTNRDWSAFDLTELPGDLIPRTNYVRACEPERFRAAQDRWVDHVRLAELRASPDAITEARERLAETRDLLAATRGVAPGDVEPELIDADLVTQARRPYTEFYRLAWRVMIPFDTERSLFAALLPPGPAHVHTVQSMVLNDDRSTVLSAGFWSALPIDYLLRITGRSHLQVTEAHAMPAPDPDHPLAGPLLLRTLRLNCLTDAYADLWAELYNPAWVDERWAVDWPGLAPLAGPVGPVWTPDTPLRSEAARRAALVEIDALVAAWLGITAEQLIAVYRSRYPILSDYEARMWFDAHGRKIAANHHTFGHGQTKDHYLQLANHLEDPATVPPPDGYTPPFTPADREAEYHHAHAAFAARLPTR